MSDLKIPDKVANPAIYRKVRKIADATYERPGAFKSMFISKKYKELGGKYTEKYNNQKKDKGLLKKWRDEKWVSVKDYLDGKIVECGKDSIGKNACRPTKKIDNKTPITIQEVIKKHGKTKVRDAVNKKLKNLDLRLNWNTLIIS